MRKALAIVVVVAALFALACWPRGAKQDAAALRVRINSDIASSDPAMKRDANTDTVMLNMLEGLVAVRGDGSVLPMLASGWTVSPDGRTYRFALRRGVRFHNGASLTSADVVWSFKRYLSKDSEWRYKSDLGPNGIAPIEAVRALNPTTVEITLARAAPLFLTELTRPDCAGTGILQRESVAPDGSWRFPIGTGPFRWGSWRRNEYVELRRFTGYSPVPGPPDGNGGGKHPLVPNVRFLVIPDSSSASAALLRGSLDIYDDVPPSELGNLAGVAGIKMTSSPSLDFYAILLQVRDPLLADVRLRRALALSLDVAALTRAATHGMALPDSSPVPSPSRFFGPRQRPLIQQDIARARALATAAGYRGQHIQLITSHTPPEMYDDAILIQAMARQAGINIDIVTLDWASQLARYSSGNYQAMVFGFSARLDPSLMYEVLIGDKAKDPRKTWDSPVAQALLRRSIDTADPKQRQQIFDQLEGRFRNDVPAIILYNTRRVTAMRKSVHGYESWPAQTQRLWNVSVDRR